jgi:uncharacterized protein YndB with AHSA1/START domain
LFIGKPGGTLAVCKVAAKAGDSFRYVWRDPDGSEMGMRGVCLEMKRPERLVATEQWDRPWYSGRAMGTITFAEEGGITTLTQTIGYESRAARDLVLQRQMEHAIALGYERLAEFLKTGKSNRKAKA